MWHTRLARACLLSVAVVVSAPGSAAAAPKVCGDQAALGGFDIARCPELRDDGAGADEAAGDGVFSTEVMLDAKDFLFYKILPEGVYNATEITQASACAPAAAGSNSPRNIVVPKVPKGAARFYFDSRDLSADQSYAPLPAGARGSGGDSLMVRSPEGAPPRWVAVGDFQAAPFDLASGALDLQPGAQRPTVLSAEVVVQKALPSGWQWKVVEGTGSYATARKYGQNGWAYPDLKVGDNCDNLSARMMTAVSAGARLRFTFAAHLGRLQVQIVDSGGADMADPAADLATPGGDLAGPPRDGASGGVDAGAGPPAGPLPGIRCDIAGGIGAARAYHPSLAEALAALVLGVTLLRSRRRMAQATHRDS